MKIRSDFITNSSSTNFILQSESLIRLPNVIDISAVEPTNLIVKYHEEIENRTHKEFSYTIEKNDEETTVVINGSYESDYEARRRDVVSTGKNLRYVERCLNLIDKRYKLPDSFPLYFEQSVECFGDGWGETEEDAGDYGFAGQGGVFKGSMETARMMLDKRLPLQCFRNEKGKLKIDFPKIFMKLGH